MASDASLEAKQAPLVAMLVGCHVLAVNGISVACLSYDDARVVLTKQLSTAVFLVCTVLKPFRKRTRMDRQDIAVVKTNEASGLLEVLEDGTDECIGTVDSVPELAHWIEKFGEPQSAQSSKVGKELVAVTLVAKPRLYSGSENSYSFLFFFNLTSSGSTEDDRSNADYYTIEHTQVEEPEDDHPLPRAF